MGCFMSKQGLSREDLRFLTRATCYDENEIKELYEGFKQNFPNGRITPVEYADTIWSGYTGPGKEQICDQGFRAMDTDKNGYIDFKEFVLYQNVASNKLGTNTELKRHFKMFNVEGNDVINQEELTKVLQVIHDWHCPDGMVATHSPDGTFSGMVPIASAEERAKNIFSRMDQWRHLTEVEFLVGCEHDEELLKILREDCNPAIRNRLNIDRGIDVEIVRNT